MPRRWKKNKLLQNFIKSRGKRAQQLKKFTLLSESSRTHDDDDHDDDCMDDMQQREDFSIEDEASLSSSDPQSMSSTGRARRSHRQNHIRQLEAWNSIQQHLLTQYINSLALPFGQLCILCPNPAQYRCCDCSSVAFYCEDCCRITHHYNHFLHMPEIWLLGQFVLAPLSVSLLLLHNGCPTAHFQQITIVSLRGMYTV